MRKAIITLLYSSYPTIPRVQTNWKLLTRVARVKYKTEKCMGGGETGLAWGKKFQELQDSFLLSEVLSYARNTRLILNVTKANK